MARVAAYQVLRDTSESPNVTEVDDWSGVPVGISWEYRFTVPAGLVTTSNRARPILDCDCSNRSRPEARFTFRMDGIEIIRATVARNSTKRIREVFDWRRLPTQPLTAGTALFLTVTRSPLSSSLSLSDIVIWYQIDTDLA